MLDTRFPRIMGDVGRPDSFLKPALTEVATGVRVADIVRPERASKEAVDTLIGAAQALQRRGADVLTTSCGFLHGVQGDVARTINVPFIASSLSLAGQLARQGHRIGLITADAPSLAPALEGIAIRFIVEGMEGSEAFSNAILADGNELDSTAIEADTTLAAQRAADKGATCILFECTNLPPYRAAVAAKAGLPVFDIFDAVESVAKARVRA